MERGERESGEIFGDWQEMTSISHRWAWRTATSPAEWPHVVGRIQ